MAEKDFDSWYDAAIDQSDFIDRYRKFVMRYGKFENPDKHLDFLNELFRLNDKIGRLHDKTIQAMADAKSKH